MFRRTEYGDLLPPAIAAESTVSTTRRSTCGTKVLRRNSNFDTAYVGIGRAMYRTRTTSTRCPTLSPRMIPPTGPTPTVRSGRSGCPRTSLVLLLIVVAVIVGVVLFFRTMGKINRRVAVSGKKRTFWQEVAYGFHVIFHPFDGLDQAREARIGPCLAVLHRTGDCHLLLPGNRTGLPAQPAQPV